MLAIMLSNWYVRLWQLGMRLWPVVIFSVATLFFARAFILTAGGARGSHRIASALMHPVYAPVALALLMLRRLVNFMRLLPRELLVLLAALFVGALFLSAAVPPSSVEL
jgi:hypothetical protein